MMITKSKKDNERILSFVNKIADVIESADSNQNFNVQDLFNRIKDGIFQTSGTIYLCFSCRSVVSRKNLKKERWFQLQNVWHDCRTEYNTNGLVVPTVGIISRWNDVIKYLNDHDV